MSQFRSPDHVSQDEDHVSKGEDVGSHSMDTVDSEIIVAATNNTDITDDELHTSADVNSAITDTTATTTSITTTDIDNIVDTITDELTAIKHTDHVMSGDNQVDDKPEQQDITTSSVKDSPGERHTVINVRSHDPTSIVTRRKRKNKFKPKE